MLRVRDPGFVGEVHACPRCGGMVLISGMADGPETDGPEPGAELAAPAPTFVLSETLEAETDFNQLIESTC